MGSYSSLLTLMKDIYIYIYKVKALEICSQNKYFPKHHCFSTTSTVVQIYKYMWTHKRQSLILTKPSLEALTRNRQSTNTKRIQKLQVNKNTDLSSIFTRMLLLHKATSSQIPILQNPRAMTFVANKIYIKNFKKSQKRKNEIILENMIFVYKIK